MTPATTLAVAVGGALGALTRVAADPAVITGAHPDLTLLLLINLTGALALGAVTGHGLPRLAPALRAGITTGFLGSFTTYSAVTTVWLGISLAGSVLLGWGYLVGSLLAGVACAWGGLEVGRWWKNATTSNVTGGSP